ncbi:hypothetical protein ACP4OV_023864 [Aristida adscensionis]
MGFGLAHLARPISPSICGGNSSSAPASPLISRLSLDSNEADFWPVHTPTLFLPGPTHGTTALSFLPPSEMM